MLGAANTCDSQIKFSLNPATLPRDQSFQKLEQFKTEVSQVHNRQVFKTVEKLLCQIVRKTSHPKKNVNQPLSFSALLPMAHYFYCLEFAGKDKRTVIDSLIQRIEQHIAPKPVGFRNRYSE